MKGVLLPMRIPCTYNTLGGTKLLFLLSTLHTRIKTILCILVWREKNCKIGEHKDPNPQENRLFQLKETRLNEFQNSTYPYHTHTNYAEYFHNQLHFSIWQIFVSNDHYSTLPSFSIAVYPKYSCSLTPAFFPQTAKWSLTEHYTFNNFYYMGTNIS